MNYQNFINQNNIENFLDFMYKFPQIYKMMVLDKNIKISNIKYNNKRRKLSCLNINNEDIQFFIDLLEIKNPLEFCSLDSGLYSYCRSNNLLNKLIYKNKRKTYKNINTIEDFQNYINDHNFNNPREFELNNKSLYTKLVKSKLSKKVYYKERKSDYSGTFDSIENVQKFIDDNKITSPLDFKTRFSRYYYKTAALGLCYKITYFGLKYKNGFLQSGWEKELYCLLIKSGYEVKTQIKYDKNHPNSRIDFEVLYNGTHISFIEIQGEHHFMKRYGNTSLEKIKRFIQTRKLDINKNRFSKINDKNMIYFCFSEYIYKKYGYPYYVFTSIKLLLKELEKIKSSKKV